MFKKLLNFAMLITLTLTCASCASLKCEHFPGTRESIADKGLGGKSIWKFGSEVFHVQTVNPTKVVASYVKWNDETDKHELESGEVVLSKLDETLFLSFRNRGSLHHPADCTSWQGRGGAADHRPREGGS